MSGGFSDIQEKAILDLLFGAVTLTPPATLYFALLTDNNTSAQRAAGTVTEVSTGVWTNYTRAAITNNATNFPAASGATASKSNGVAINFGTAAISGTAPVVTAIAVYSAASGGVLQHVQPLGATQTVNNGSPVSFAIGAWSATLNES